MARFNADGSLFATPKRVSVRPKPDPATLYPAKMGSWWRNCHYKGKELSMVLSCRRMPRARCVGAESHRANLPDVAGKLEGRE